MSSPRDPLDVIARAVEDAPAVSVGGGGAGGPPPPGDDWPFDDDEPAPEPPQIEGADPRTLAHCAGLEQNDTDNGQRLLAHHGPEVLHVREVGWHVWDGRRWLRDGGDEAIVRRAQRTAKLIHLEADHLAQTLHEVRLLKAAEAALAKKADKRDDADRRAIADADAAREALSKRKGARRKFAVSSGNASRVGAMVGQALPHCTIGPNELDADGWLLNVENGTLRFAKVEDEDDPGDEAPRHCLRVERLDHDRGHRLTKLAPVAYDPRATCPRFEAFLARFQPEPAIRDFLQVYHGLALTAITGPQCFIFNYGSGANGKSTFTKALAALFGPYADSLNAESLTGQNQRRGDQATPDFAELPGVRYLVVSELPRGEDLKEALIKALTGGDAMKVRHLNKGFFTFVPVFKAAMSGNDLPRITGGDAGIWRRVNLVPWSVTIPAEERRDMAEVLAEFAAERSGILNWLIAGLDRFMREGLRAPEAVVLATAAYREEMDPIQAFADDCIEAAPGEFVTARAMYEAFVSWCLANAVRPWKETAFGRAMPHKGFERENTRVRRYLNVRLHDVPERPLEPRYGRPGDADGT